MFHHSISIYYEEDTIIIVIIKVIYIYTRVDVHMRVYVCVCVCLQPNLACSVPDSQFSDLMKASNKPLPNS